VDSKSLPKRPVIRLGLKNPRKERK